MSEELMPFDLPENNSSIIKVVGVGGGGSNAVNHMYKMGIKDVNFVVSNTDSQALENSPVPVKIQLGSSLTEGRGAGNKPAIGRDAALENLDDIIEILSSNTKMVFITAGMGGGTGTGAAPVIAKTAKDLGILTIGIVTLPFRFEGKRRQQQAIEGIREMKKHVDSLLIINNEKLREIHGDCTMKEAFANADNVLTVAAKGIADIITDHGHINVDFADVQTVMSESGVALMGSATASGENRAIIAIENALNSPLLDNNDITGATNILLNIISGTDEVTMDEIGQINEFVQEAAGYNADLIWGSTKDESLGDKIGVTVIATGFKSEVYPEIGEEKKKTVHNLKDNKSYSKRSDDFFEIQDRTGNRKTTKPVEKSNSYFTNTPKDIELEDEDPFSEIGGLNDTFLLDDDLAEERFETLIKSHDAIHQKNYSRSNYTENVDELESEPAYKRKKMEVDVKKRSDEVKVSKYTLSDDSDHSVRLRKNNSYLHDLVD